MIPAYRMTQVPPSGQDQVQRVVLYFFFQKSNDRAVNTASAALRTIIHQFINQVPAVLPILLQRYDVLSAKRDFEWSWDNLPSLFAEMLQQAPLSPKVYIVLDALNEIEAESLVLILDWIKELVYEDSPFSTLQGSRERLRILVTSRPEVDMIDDLSGVPTLDISKTDTISDLEALIQNWMKEFAPRRHLKPEVTKHIIQFLESNANGMFLWVVLIMKELEKRDERLSDEVITSKLSSIPLTLADTYEAILDNVPATRRQDFWRIIRWLLYASRGLSLTELEAALCLETSQSGWHDLSGDLRFLCGSLTRFESTGERVGFIHQTARDFLDACSRDSKLATVRGFAMETDAANEDLALTCVKYLLNNEIFLQAEQLIYANRMQHTYLEATSQSASTTEWIVKQRLADILVRSPFLRYAIESWGFHAQAIGSPSSTMSTMIRQMLSSRSRRNIIMALTYGVKHRLWTWPLYSDHAPIHLAAYFGVPWLVRTYISEDKTCVHATCPMGGTPLIWASETGSIECVRELLDAGADPNKFERDGWSALHWAACNGHVDIATLLLERGASLDQVDDPGLTPLNWARLRKHLKVVDVLEEWANKCLASNFTALQIYSGLQQ